MELIEDTRVLASLGLEAAGDLTQRAQGRRERRCGFRFFRDGEAGAGVGFDRIGLFRSEDGDTIILVAFGIAARNGFAVRQGLQEGERGFANMRQEARIAQHACQRPGGVQGGTECDVAHGEMFRLGELSRNQD